MELERKYVTLSKQKGHAVSQVTLEEDLNVPDQKPDIFRIVHRQGEFCPDEIKGEAGKEAGLFASPLNVLEGRSLGLSRSLHVDICRSY